MKEGGLTKMQVAWLEKGEIVPRVHGLEGTTSDEVNDNAIRVISIDAYHRAIKDGHEIPPYFLVRQSFADSGDWQDQQKISDFVQMIRTTFTRQMLSIKEAGSQHASQMEAACFADLLERSKAGYNALDLRNLALADEPLFTRWSELTLLRSLVDTRAGGSKSGRIEYQDLLGCMSFNLVGNHASYSGPHVDALSGTWVRVLLGTILWLIPDKMDEADWKAPREFGPAWLPSGTCKIIVLERVNVLVMRPGRRVVHAAMSLDPCVLRGGMFWDYGEVEDILKDLLWLIDNPLATNEELALQLPDAIE
ncbi:Hypothetical protein D9617_48g089410 [Elsinoe fawcettii]|nr:Hypothetical protein D9617_48g089410 [Elsinoe fawcettii]